MSKTIELAEVRVGDLVEGAYKSRYHAPDESATYRGRVTSVTQDEVRTESFTFRPTYYPTLTLLDRPEPVEPTKTGTIVKTEKGRTFIRVPSDIRPGGFYPWVWFTDGLTADAAEWGHVVRQGVVEVIEP